MINVYTIIPAKKITKEFSFHTMITKEIILCKTNIIDYYRKDIFLADCPK